MDARPIIVDLCCGAGGWAYGFIAAGFRVIGFDIVRHDSYPGQLVIQDVRTISGHTMRGKIAGIIASPPCTEFSQVRHFPSKPRPNIALAMELVEHCWRIAREAGVKIILENVRGAQRHIGYARAHAGSFYLWGDVPALLPVERFTKGMYATARGAKLGPWRKGGTARSVVPFELALHVARTW